MSDLVFLDRDEYGINTKQAAAIDAVITQQVEDRVGPIAAMPDFAKDELAQVRVLVKQMLAPVLSRLDDSKHMFGNDANNGILAMEIVAGLLPTMIASLTSAVRPLDGPATVQ